MNKIRFWVLMCFLLFVMTGCYDNREIDTVATVMAVGIEEGVKNGEKVYTFALSDTGSLKNDSAGDGTRLVCCSQKGKDINSAIYALDKKISKTVSFSHLSAIFFSKKTAQKGMYEDMSFFEKNYKVRPQVIVAISEISPEKYLENLSPELEVNPEKYFRSIFQKSRSYVANVTLREFTDTYHSFETVFVPIISGKETEKKLKEEDASITSHGVLYRGRLIADGGNEPFSGLFFSKKIVQSKNAFLRSIKKPEINLEIKGDNPQVMIKFFVRCYGEINQQVLRKEFAEYLESYAKRGIDVINIKKYATREYFTIKAYEEMNWAEIIKNTKFNINIVLEEGDDTWVGKY